VSQEFDELVGDDIPPAERERLLRAHDALVAAGPMPELPPELEEPVKPPTADIIPYFPKRRYAAASIAAAALIAVAFGAGYLAGHHGTNGGGFSAERKLRMHPTAQAPDALASLQLAKQDGNGNWPMLLKLSGLHKLASGAYYELWLTKNGKPIARCGGFRASEDTTTVTLSVSYELKTFDGWVVTEQDPGQREPGPVLLTT
jgi:hypothetical protein